jgi:hypothetical protein
MFGYSSFSTPTFADLGSQLYVGDALENTTLADSSTGFGNFVSVIVEPITSADSSLVLASFLSSAVESFGAADTPSVIKTMYVSITEPQTILDAATVIANFVASRTEGITSADSVQGIFAYFAAITEALTVANAQTATVYYANNVVIEVLNIADVPTSIANFVASDVENINLIDAPLGFAWIKIDNTESTQWVLVDNRQ